MKFTFRDLSTGFWRGQVQKKQKKRGLFDYFAALF